MIQRSSPRCPLRGDRGLEFFFAKIVCSPPKKSLLNCRFAFQLGVLNLSQCQEFLLCYFGEKMGTNFFLKSCGPFGESLRKLRIGTNRLGCVLWGISP